MRLFGRFLIVILGLLLVARFLPGIGIDSPYTAVVVAVLLGLVNIFIKPVLFVLTLPLTILSLGLFTLVLNALLFWFVASFVEGFSVEGFLPAFLGTLIISALSWIGNRFL